MVGKDQYGGSRYKETMHFSHYVFQTACAVAANSIVSGGAAERMNIFGYTILSIVFSLVIYPFCAHWGFAPDGWLVEMGYHDFAGSGTIHAMAGVGALVTTAFLGPRKNRYKPEDAEMFEPNNPTYIALSTLSVIRFISIFSSGHAGFSSMLGPPWESARRARMWLSGQQQ
jgi:Amt family ammonium transporter